MDLCFNCNFGGNKKIRYECIICGYFLWLEHRICIDCRDINHVIKCPKCPKCYKCYYCNKQNKDNYKCAKCNIFICATCYLEYESKCNKCKNILCKQCHFKHNEHWFSSYLINVT